MGTLGCIHDMMRRDKENRELRRRNRERMKETRRRMTECRHTELPPTLSVEKLEEIQKTDTRKRTSRPKPCLQNQTDCRVSHAYPSSIMRILALNLYTLFISVRLSGAV